MRLADKVALVTGASRGIGRGIAERFAAEGAQVGILDLDIAACQSVVVEIAAAGGRALALAADISDPAQVETAVGALRERFGPVEALVNNAAIMPTGTLHETRIEDFERCLAVNLRGDLSGVPCGHSGYVVSGQGQHHPYRERHRHGGFAGFGRLFDDKRRLDYAGSLYVHRLCRARHSHKQRLAGHDRLAYAA